MDKVNISFGITACNENKELAQLLTRLEDYVKDEDEIVILLDKDNHTDEVLQVCKGFGIRPNYNSLDDNFGKHKNKLNELCSKDYIFQLDADEIPNELLLENLHDIIEENDVDLIYVPRWNEVSGITDEYINKMNWKLDDAGRINWADFQSRIYKNDPSIKWEGEVHETITGFDNFVKLPEYEELCLYHFKTFDRQKKQNEMYDKIER